MHSDQSLRFARSSGVSAGAVFPQLSTIIDSFRIDSISLPIALGLLLMMRPPLAKVKYEERGKIKKASKMFAVSIFQN
jgi:ACR3 family arsenite transporter